MSTVKLPFLTLIKGEIEQIEIQLPALIPTSDDFRKYPTIVKIQKACLILEMQDLSK